MRKLIGFLRLLRFDLLILFYRCKPCKKTDKVNNVLLIPGGHMGDVIVEISAWQLIIEHFKQQGKRIYVLSTKVAWNILQMAIDTEGIHFLEGDMNTGKRGSKGWSIDITKRLFDSIKIIEFDTAIGHIRDRYLHFIVYAIPAKQKFLIVPQKNFAGIHGKTLFRLLADKNATNIIRSPGIPEVEYWQQMLQMLGLPDDKLHIMPITPQCEQPIHQRKYVTISVDSMHPARLWPTELFVKLIQCLLDSFQYDICITGQNVSSDALRPYEQFAASGRFFNFVNKTNLKEWIELIRGAQFHIGVDSGSIHIAASVDTQAFCLAGFWNGMEFMPYHLREVENTKTPICIYRKDVPKDSLNCYGCAKKRYGYGNAACLAQCKAGQPCICLAQITPEDVMDAIYHAQETGAIK